MIWIAILFSLYTSILYLFKISESKYNPKWLEYHNEVDGVDKYTEKISEKLSKVVAISNDFGTFGKFLEQHLKNGRTFATSIEIFFSVVLAHTIIGITIILLALSFNATGYYLLLFILLGFFISYYPWNKLFSKSKERVSKINDSLPDFIDLLIMVLPTTSPIPALSFTAERSNGVVANEIRNLVRTVSSRGSASDLEAFNIASDRLATPEAKSFITTLQNAYLEGVPAVETLRQQSLSLRRQFFQKKRGEAKKLPTKLIIIFAIHFLPLLITLALLPVIVGMGTGI
jgi:Flp pilus assembly protein TadB